MNCHDFELNVLALARNELIDAARRDLSLAHAENCVRCADRLAGERGLIACVRLVVAELADEKAPGHVGAALLRAFREQTPAVTGTTVIPMPRRFARHWRLEAIAAMILITISVLTVWVYSRSSNQRPERLMAITTSSTRPQPESTPANHDTQATRSLPPSSPPIRVRRQPTRRSVNRAEEVTEFFPLMDGIDVDELEAAQSVRVELPASALMDLGLRAGPELPEGPVKADVLLGHDGLARAIRFVR